MDWSTPRGRLNVCTKEFAENRRAGLMIVEAYAFGAFRGDDVIDVLGERGMGFAAEFPRRPAGVDRGVGAFGLARPAVDAFAGYRRGHRVSSPLPGAG